MGADLLYDPGPDGRRLVPGAGRGALLRHPPGRRSRSRPAEPARAAGHRAGHRAEPDRLAVPPGQPYQRRTGCHQPGQLLAEPGDLLQRAVHGAGRGFRHHAVAQAVQLHRAQPGGLGGGPGRAGAGVRHEPGLQPAGAAGLEHAGHAHLVLRHHALAGRAGHGRGLAANYAYLQRAEPSPSATQGALLRGALRWIALSALVLLVVELVTAPLQLAYLAGGAPAAAASAALITGQYAVVFGLRLVLVFIGAGVLAAFLYRNALSAGREKLLINLAYLTFALVLIGEVLGRFLFYAAHVKIGLWSPTGWKRVGSRQSAEG